MHDPALVQRPDGLFSRIGRSLVASPSQSQALQNSAAGTTCPFSSKRMYHLCALYVLDREVGAGLTKWRLVRSIGRPVNFSARCAHVQDLQRCDIVYMMEFDAVHPVGC